jgi:hypothetical protein
MFEQEGRRSPHIESIQLLLAEPLGIVRGNEEEQRSERETTLQTLSTEFLCEMRMKGQPWQEKGRGVGGKALLSTILRNRKCIIRRRASLHPWLYTGPVDGIFTLSLILVRPARLRRKSIPFQRIASQLHHNGFYDSFEFTQLLPSTTSLASMHKADIE